MDVAVVLADAPSLLPVVSPARGALVEMFMDHETRLHSINLNVNTPQEAGAKTQTGFKDVCARAEETARFTVLDHSFDGVATKTQVLKEDQIASDGCE